MGEKGNVLDPSAVAGAAGSASVVERITSTTTETVIDAGQDLAGTIRDKSIEAVADTTMDTARDKLKRGDQAGPADTPTDTP